MNKEIETENYKLDIFKTMGANIFWVMLFMLVVFFVIVGYNQISQIETEMNYTLAAIVYFFAVVKLTLWLGKPHLYFRYV